MGRVRWHTLKHTPTHPLIIYTLSMVEGEGGGVERRGHWVHTHTMDVLSCLGGLGAQEPGPDEAGPDPGPQDVDGEREAGHIVLQLLPQVGLLRGVVHQDHLLHQLHRRPDPRKNIRYNKKQQ